MSSAIKQRLEQLHKAQQDGSGWVDKAIGEYQLVKDAVPGEHQAFMDDITDRREKKHPRERSVTAGEASLIKAIHVQHVLPAINDAVRYETATDRAVKAAELAQKGQVHAPEANDAPAEVKAKKPRAKKTA